MPSSLKAQKADTAMTPSDLDNIQKQLTKIDNRVARIGEIVGAIAAVGSGWIAYIIVIDHFGITVARVVALLVGLLALIVLRGRFIR